VLSEETIAIDVERRLRDLADDSPSEAFLIQVNPRVAAILIGGGGKPLQELEEQTRKHFHFEGTESIPLDTFSITAEGSRKEIEARALPFREGEEVFIEIEEPHMYNVDDAIAKIDGYVISIAGGGPHVGERKLIRINEVKRTAAYASIVSENGAAPEAPAREPQEEAPEIPVEHASEAAVRSAEEPDEDPARGGRLARGDAAGSDGEVESNGTRGRRRRGRRGGRRRSGSRSSSSS
jgi:ribonuclease G